MNFLIYTCLKTWMIQFILYTVSGWYMLNNDLIYLGLFTFKPLIKNQPWKEKMRKVRICLLLCIFYILSHTICNTEECYKFALKYNRNLPVMSYYIWLVKDKQCCLCAKLPGYTYYCGWLLALAVSNNTHHPYYQVKGHVASCNGIRTSVVGPCVLD